MSDKATKSATQGYFNITSIHRTDLYEILGEEKANSLTDTQMLRIADKMANAYLEQSFWTDLEIIAEYVLNDTT